MSDRRLLAIDLGSRRVGWAFFRGAELVAVGAWELETKRTESPGFRWIRFRSFLESVLQVSRLRVDVLAYEEVRNHVSRGKGGRPSFNVSAAHAYGGAQAILLEWADSHRIPYSSVPVQRVKAAATGLGGGKGTDKESVLAAARRRWPRLFLPLEAPFRESPFDEADAAMIGLAMLIDLGEAEPTPPPQKEAKDPTPRKAPAKRSAQTNKRTASAGLFD